MARADWIAEQARMAADFLESIGEAKHAEAVRSVIRSAGSARVTCATLHRDNTELRAKLGG